MDSEVIVAALSVTRSQECPFSCLTPGTHRNSGFAVVAMVAIALSDRVQRLSVRCFSLCVCVYLFICNWDNNFALGHLFFSLLRLSLHRRPNRACHSSCLGPWVDWLSFWLIILPSHVMLALQYVLTRHCLTHFSHKLDHELTSK